MEVGGNPPASCPLSARKPRTRYIHRPVTPCWTLIYSGRDPGVTSAHQPLQNMRHDSTEFYWFRLARPFRQQDLARCLRRPGQQMERQCLAGPRRLLLLCGAARLRVLPGRPEHARPFRPLTRSHPTGYLDPPHESRGRRARGNSSRIQVEISPTNHPDILSTNHFLLPQEYLSSEAGSGLSIFFMG